MHIQQSVSTTDDGSLKTTHETGINGGDNIITITTASINECNASYADSVEQIKSSQKSEISPTERIVHFKSTATEIDSNSNASTTEATSSQQPQQQQQQQQRTKKKPWYDFCNESQCISFQDNIADVHHRKGRRLNGLQLPLHPLQVFGWLVLILFGIASFWVLIPSFSNEIQGPLYGLIAGLYVVHVISHVAALLIDPADRELLRIHRNDRIVPEFDRSKHAHVIENGRCHLCNIATSSTHTKHCSVCNKCVGKFDHHCKWLNHCVGSRNYVAFLMCVVSAVIATLVIVAAVISQIVLYYVQPQWLSFWYANAGSTITANGVTADGEGAAETIALTIANFTTTILNDSNVTTTGFELGGNTTNATTFLLDNEFYLDNLTLPTLINNITSLIRDGENATNSAANSSTVGILLEAKTTMAAATEASNGNNTVATIAGISTSDTIFLILIGFLGLLAAITAGLLLHLCFFHIYISFLGLTTYEYIRNHRQAHEAKAKAMISNLPKNGPQHLSTNPSKKTNECGQIYFCSGVRHPNAIDPTDLRYFETRKQNSKNNEDPHTKLHCCANSREYHQTALKTYYMCSLLEEGDATNPLSIAHISGGGGGGGGEIFDNHENEPTDTSNFKTFHCCSTFGAATSQRKVSAATTKATLVTDLEALSARRSYLQYTEQCTFCTFRIRSPIVAKRSSAGAISTHSVGRQQAATLKTEVTQTSKPASATSKATSTEHQRCCMKAISKHQRWRRKWNCCSSVPDSPDVPNDIIAALAIRHQHGSTATSANKINATEIPVHFIKTANGGAAAGCNSRPTSPHSANLKAQTRANNARTWPMPRLRHMMRMINRYRRPRCRHNNVGSAVIAGEQIKQNQIRPLQLHSNSNGCHHHHSYLQQRYYDSSSPQPPSSTTTASERSSDQSIYSDSSAITTPSSTATIPNTIETILPTSIIRDDMSMTYTTPVGITLPPALPPPTRRKIPNPTDLEELAETLGFAGHPSSGGTSITLSPVQRLPALNNVYRRQRRKHFLRTRSPTLSPIHETGLSNPTSPQPCRHNIASCSTSTTANTNNNTATTTVSAVVNSLCGSSSSELMRKTSTSNSSLHSVSSNSSSN